MSKKIKSIRRGDRVYAAQDMTFTYPKRKPSTIKAGTRGRVRGLRELPTDDCRKALVKFEGYGCLKAVDIDQISTTRPASSRKHKPVRQTASLNLELDLQICLPKGLKWDAETLWKDVEDRIHSVLLGRNVMLRTGVNRKNMGQIIKARVEVTIGSRA